MNRLYVFGENHWVIPLGENVEMVKLTNILIDQELIAEKMLGSELKRDQLNFLYNSILYIYKSPVQEKLLGEAPDNEVVIEYVIPKLTVLRYLDHIVRMTKAKRSDVLKQERMEEFLSVYRTGQTDIKTNTNNISIHDEQKNDDKEPGLSGSPKKRDIKTPFISALEDEDTPEDLEKFGRYWVWSDYFPEELKEEIIKGAEMLRNINVAVRQDLADDFVATALKIQPNMQKGRAEIIKRKKEKPDTQDPTEKIRPPRVWNHTDIIETKHEYRANARPNDIYLDNRVKEMNSHIESLARELRSYRIDRWTELVQRVIGFFKDHRDEEHHEIESLKLPQTF